MFKDQTALFLYAETSVHLGSGTSLGVIDLAIQRERFTDLPIGASTGLKGVLRDVMTRKAGKSDADLIAAFGPDTDKAGEHAGALAFTDMRLLLFPVRSLKGVFAWATCRLVLERFRRDMEAAHPAAPESKPFELPPLPPTVKPGHALVATNNGVADAGNVVLEEYQLTAAADDSVQKLGEWLAANALPKGVASEYWKKRLPRHLVVLRDDDFRDYAKNSTEVVARIKLNDKKTTTEGGGNLFYQENLPAESLMYALAFAQDDFSEGNRSASDILKYLHTADGQLVQIGGDASTGRGLTHLRFF